MKMDPTDRLMLRRFYDEIHCDQCPFMKYYKVVENEVMGDNGELPDGAHGCVCDIINEWLKAGNQEAP